MPDAELVALPRTRVAGIRGEVEFTELHLPLK